MFVISIIISAFQFVIDGLFAAVVKFLPDKWFGVEKSHYSIGPQGRALYEKLKIRKWKDKVWELGGLGGFRKNKIAHPNNLAYIEKFIIESHKGIFEHRIGCFAGFLCILIIPFKYSLSIAVPVAFVNLILNILPVMILRYNLPKLHALRKRIKTQEKLKKLDEDEKKQET